MTGIAPGRGVFLTFQQELLASVSAHAVTVVEKSRRTGYSWAAAAIAALWAGRAKSAGGMDVFYMGYNLEMAREFIEYVAEWAKAFDLAAGAAGEFFFPDPANPDKTIQAFRITFASGFKVVALPSVARALRGMQGLVIIDEAAFHDDLAEVLKAAFALLIWGGKVLVISTHNGEGNAFNTLIEEVRAGRKPYNLLRCTFDDALADGLYRRVCQKLGKEWSPEDEAAWRENIIAQYGDAADEELFCVPSKGGGAYFPMPLVEICASAEVPVLRLALPESFAALSAHLREAEVNDWLETHVAPHLGRLSRTATSFAGQDFARHGDLSVLWPLQIASSMARDTPFVIEMRRVPFEQQRQILFWLLDRLPNFSGAALDAGGNGAYLAEVAWQRYGDRIAQVKFTADWYRENMPPLKAAFEDQAVVIPKDRDIIDDLRMVRTVGGVARVPDLRRADTSGAKGEKRHGDAAIALALAYFASRNYNSLAIWEALA
ncbi:terminase large subunit domain-containing protein [Telmatospirillum sp. J64-1]|uniref:terminase large subunit domain-containing protein n=1 Tax=Telmatospirillum sp. J64-1 TaxID=2502183 RepID=UPI00163DDAB3|nr:terminase family protein [Telmatospirillum sp. J64-1]